MPDAAAHECGGSIAAGFRNDNVYTMMHCDNYEAREDALEVLGSLEADAPDGKFYNGTTIYAFAEKGPCNAEG